MHAPGKFNNSLFSQIYKIICSISSYYFTTSVPYPLIHPLFKQNLYSIDKLRKRERHLHPTVLVTHNNNSGGAFLSHLNSCPGLKYGPTYIHAHSHTKQQQPGRGIGSITSLGIRVCFVAAVKWRKNVPTTKLCRRGVVVGEVVSLTTPTANNVPFIHSKCAEDNATRSSHVHK